MYQNIVIREARLGDAARLLDIYDYYIQKTAITYEYERPSLSEFQERMRSIKQKYPYLVIEADGSIQGYVYAHAFIGRRAADWDVEVSIYLDHTAQRCGLGRSLYQALEAALKAMGIINLYAAIAYPQIEDEFLNKNSAAFHAHLGYEKTAHFPNCGYKFGRWYDLIWMAKRIGEYLSPQPAVKAYHEILG